MDQNFKFPEHLPLQEILRLANSPAGQQLIEMVRQQSGSGFQQAMERAAAGDYSQAKHTMERVMADPQAQKLLKELRGDSFERNGR